MEEAKIEEQKKNKLLGWIEEHPKTVFASRIVLWSLLAGVLPFIFIAWRYDIFTTASKMKLTGWGFIAIIIAIVFISTLLKYIYKGLKPGLAKQCITGFVKVVLPLVIFYCLVMAIEGNIALFKQALGCTILCETVAIPINPFPAWIHERAKEDKNEEQKTMADIFWGKFFDKKKEENKGD